MDKIEQAIQSFIAHKLAEGFHDEDRVIEQAMSLFVNQEAFCPSYFDFLQGEETQRPEKIVRPHVERITAQLFDERRRLEATWKDATDCDRLDQAFAELEREGIVARQNLPCCLTCANAEVSKILLERRKLGQRTLGYVLYHEQDTARVPDGQLLLAFGSAENDRMQTVAIGRRITELLRQAGLNVDWKDNPDARIVVNLVWNKRRFSTCGAQ